MRILLVHQNFPGQYSKLLPSAVKIHGHQCIALKLNKAKQQIQKTEIFPGLQLIEYPIFRGNTNGIHPWALETESKIIRGEACAAAAHQLKTEGFTPDLICAHPGWGEALFLKAIWPEVPMLCYQEFFYQSHGFDLDFDPEFQPILEWKDQARTITKNAYLHLTQEQSSWNLTPTQFQRSSFPSQWQQSISVIHDGINTQQAAPADQPIDLKLPDGHFLRSDDSIVTFVNRYLEPYRGCHTFIRAIPEIQRLAPKAKIVIIGATQGVSYGKPCPKGEWKDMFFEEISGQFNPDNICFAGSLPYGTFLKLLQLSSCHVYLTYPFVLSWSLMEAMSTACPIVGSATAPVQEMIQHGNNGLLVDFFKPADLAAAIAELLLNKELAQKLGCAARQTILQNYSLEQCIPQHLALMELVSTRALKH